MCVVGLCASRKAAGQKGGPKKLQSFRADLTSSAPPLSLVRPRRSHTAATATTICGGWADERRCLLGVNSGEENAELARHPPTCALSKLPSPQIRRPLRFKVRVHRNRRGLNHLLSSFRFRQHQRGRPSGLGLGCFAPCDPNFDRIELVMNQKTMAAWDTTSTVLALHPLHNVESSQPGLPPPSAIRHQTNLKLCQGTDDVFRTSATLHSAQNKTKNQETETSFSCRSGPNIQDPTCQPGPKIPTRRVPLNASEPE